MTIKNIGNRIGKDAVLVTVNGVDGRAFNVRLVLKGGAYGRDNCLTHSESEPLVEFHDAKHAGDTFGPLGQFVSRYYRSTLLGASENCGLNLHGGEPAWSIPAEEMKRVLDALRAGVAR